MSKIVKNTTFISPLDLLAPHSCRGCGHTGSPLCERCKNYILAHHQAICPNCKSHITSAECQNCTDLPPTYIVGERQDLIGTLIHDYKYHSIRSLAQPLAELIDSILPSFSSDATIVPLPTIKKHIRARSFDHTYLIAQKLSKIRHYKLSPILMRINNTVQVGADLKTRSTQAISAYSISPTSNINPQMTYILLDDVWTTGASMKAATEKLQQAGVKNIIITILALSRID